MEVNPGTFRFKYLLVFIDIYSGWTEAFPTKQETTQVVAKKLGSEIVPRFGLPTALGSDNGPVFITQPSQSLAKVLGINWKLHCIYRAQSSGQVERMNRTLKETLIKFKLETGENRVSLLPFTLFRAWCAPYCKGITPYCKGIMLYEIMLGRPPPLLPKLGEEKLIEVKSLQALHLAWQETLQLVSATRTTAQHPVQPHNHSPGDWIWVKTVQPASLEPHLD
uniref:Integrase catalytic domain-containing protein n=1 Tax=Rousettus aegyptiacus TaxID=9407 RepID=A0A7J8EKH9_ROUAE|nr:hypothetical protein HJG63_012554 [Rousettus aegyptiacus]